MATINPRRIAGHTGDGNRENTARDFPRDVRENTKLCLDSIPPFRQVTAQLPGNLAHVQPDIPVGIGFVTPAILTGRSA